MINNILISWLVISSLIHGLNYFFYEGINRKYLPNYLFWGTAIILPIALTWICIISFSVGIYMCLQGGQNELQELLSSKKDNPDPKSNEKIRKFNEIIYPQVGLLTCLTGFLLSLIIINA